MPENVLARERVASVPTANPAIIGQVRGTEMSHWLSSRARLFLIMAQLGLVLWAANQYAIEESFGFAEIIPLIFVGFVIHSLLPRPLRLPFFLFLSLGAIVTILGFKQGGALITMGMGLVVICHLPFAFAIRVGLLVATGAGLAVVRAGWIDSPWESLPTLILPILGAMFMFRLMIYLYDLRHEKEPASIWQRLSYFFMLPNVCFLLFPVVDYQTFRRSYYDAKPEDIYQKGLLWMMRGIVHLLLYRAVYYHLLPSAEDVVDLGGVVLFMLTTYALYLRISGLFHLVIGVMCLFGFNLPETHHLYYLASSFTDYWRRINIYWKDFMLKLFYYPSLMKFRRWGMETALVLSTVVVFASTWILHSYQWFWLQGAFPLAATDALFWGILGGLVIVSSLREARRTRKRTLKKQEWSFRSALVYAARVVGMFVAICTLWSLWSSESVKAWISLVAVAGDSSAASWLMLAIGLTLLVGVGVLVQYLTHRGWSLTLVGGRLSSGRSVAYVSLVSVILLLAASPAVQKPLGESSADFVASLQSEELNDIDRAQMERGYYEGLLDGGGFVTALRKLKGMPDVDAFDFASGVRATGDILVKEMAPNATIAYSGVTVRTNRWGIRDKDYTLEKPPGTYRMALVGASHLMGNGVENHQIFEALVEERISRDSSNSVHRYELINFAVTGYGPVQLAHVVREKLAPFQPDAVLFFTQPDQIERAADKVAPAVYRGARIDDPELQRIVARSGARPGMSVPEVTRRLEPYGEELLKWSYDTAVDAARSMGATPVWVFIPWVHEKTDPDRLASLTQRAREAGFIPLSLDGAYDEHPDRASLQVAPWDTHPNAEGHRLLAEKFYNELVVQEGELGLRVTFQGRQLTAATR